MNDINLILQKCFKNGIKVYPESDKYKWYIHYEIVGKKHKFDKEVKPKDINNAIAKTYEYLYKKYC